MGGVLGKRPRVAAAPDADDAGGVPDHRDAAGLDEKGLSGRAVARVEDEARGGLADAAGPKDKELAEESGRAVAHVDVQPIDARAQGNGDCPRAADLTVRLFLPKDKEVTEGSGRTVDGVLDHTDHAVAAGLDEKALSGRAVARVEVQQPIDARAQGNGDLTQAEGRKLVDIGATGGAASSGQPQQQQQQDEEDKEVTHFSHKTLEKSMLTIAAEESDEAMDRVLKLCSSAMQLKTHYPNKPKKTKQEYWRSASADTTALAKIVQGAKDREENSIKVTTRLARIHFCQKLPSAEVVTSRPNTATNYRSPGWDLIEWEGCFAVPTDSVSGNPFVDEMNIILFDIMMSVTQLLEGGQIRKSLSEVGGECKKTEADRRAAIRKLRNTCKSIRAVILNLGYLPLKEPVDSWRNRFHLVKF